MALCRYNRRGFLVRAGCRSHGRSVLHGIIRCEEDVSVCSREEDARVFGSVCLLLTLFVWIRKRRRVVGVSAFRIESDAFRVAT